MYKRLTRALVFYKYEVFFIAVRAWLANPRQYEGLRVFGDSTDEQPAHLVPEQYSADLSLAENVGAAAGHVGKSDLRRTKEGYVEDGFVVENEPSNDSEASQAHATYEPISQTHDDQSTGSGGEASDANLPGEAGTDTHTLTRSDSDGHSESSSTGHPRPSKSGHGYESLWTIAAKLVTPTSPRRSRRSLQSQPQTALGPFRLRRLVIHRPDQWSLTATTSHCGTATHAVCPRAVP